MKTNKKESELLSIGKAHCKNKVNSEYKMATDNIDNLNSSNIKRLHIESSNEDLLKNGYVRYRLKIKE